MSTTISPHPVWLTSVNVVLFEMICSSGIDIEWGERKRCSSSGGFVSCSSSEHEFKNPLCRSYIANPVFERTHKQFHLFFFVSGRSLSSFILNHIRHSISDLHAWCWHCYHMFLSLSLSSACSSDKRVMHFESLAFHWAEHSFRPSILLTVDRS